MALQQITFNAGRAILERIVRDKGRLTQENRVDQHRSYHPLEN